MLADVFGSVVVAIPFLAMAFIGGVAAERHRAQGRKGSRELSDL